MTRGSVREYLEAIQGRYHKATRPEKGQILDEFTRVTGYHRKAAIRLLTQGYKKAPVSPRGRTRQYGPAVVAALKVAWESSDRMCSRRLQPFLPQLLQVLQRHGELVLEPEIKAQLCRMSAATIDRLLRPSRQRGGAAVPSAPPSQAVCSKPPFPSAPLPTGTINAQASWKWTWWPTAARAPKDST
jgi:hypothetical protein